MAENALVAKQIGGLLKTPFFLGSGEALGGILTTLGYAGVSPTKLPDVPGFLDNLASAIESERPVIYSFRPDGERVPASWYEMVRDGTVFGMIGNYLSCGLRFIAYASPTAGEFYGEREVEEIRRKYPTKDTYAESKVVESIQKTISEIYDRQTVHGDWIIALASQLYKGGNEVG
jgi:hypothetical protein